MPSSESIPNSKALWKSYRLSIGLVVLLFTLGIFMGLFIRNQQLVMQATRNTAKAFFRQIVLTRSWNADHGGVFVLKKPGQKSNPYLINPDITATNGNTYTKVNPAFMTRQISVYAAQRGHFHFNLTSLKPLNPSNQPDKFERQALRSFEQGHREAVEILQENGKWHYRYMAPLYVEPSCLPCHPGQGYKVGDVRGGISVTSDITSIQSDLRLHRWGIWGLALLTVINFLGIIYFVTQRLIKRLDAAQSKIEKMAITDELTGLYNRRYFFTALGEECRRALRYGHSLGLAMLDVDLFKKVNDRCGHPGGDEVLKGVTAAIKAACRDADVVARYGGEEIVIMLPETSLAGAAVMAEKIRRDIEALHMVHEGRDIQVTVSLGVAALQGEALKADNAGEDLLAAADAALYRAKETGRNRVEQDQTP